MYKIKIVYDTGDSFHTERDVTEYLSITFEDKEKAKKAIKDIEEHYDLYVLIKQDTDISEKQKERILRSSRNKTWFYTEDGKSSWEDWWQYKIRLEEDNGKIKDIHVFWTGYFETLVGAYIEESSDDMSFIPNSNKWKGRHN